MNGVGLASDGEERADFFLLSITRKIVVSMQRCFVLLCVPGIVLIIL